jgi:hypothetical protein
VGGAPQAFNQVKLLLDTHVAIRCLAEPKKLSKNQARALEEAVVIALMATGRRIPHFRCSL